ncbi:hypothetical protein FNV43_RR18022 [Rhamnella rubrinervis]|uniref:RBR-type E3 ubiquitin transferase n=1 Tax=Rhamnella rubrinervis TaxID=2594499 RepID=A0A8K0E5G3_9ROSA|nr:hypothetical protein FNV43_RR18022 [Rhamnella rubrinervis]
MKKKEDAEESGRSSTKKAKMAKKDLSESSSAFDQVVDVEEDDKSNAVAVDQHYSKDRDLHITATGSNLIDLSLQSLENFNDYGDEKTTTSTPLGKRKRSSTSACSSILNNIEPVLQVPHFLCEICFETRSANESFTIKGCDHAYCSDCMSKYVASKLEENVTRIGCPVPDCKQGLLDPDYCRSILPLLVFDRWGYVLCEAAIPESDKFYCPFEDCSALLILNEGKLEAVKESSSSSECPNCKRMFCLRCKVPWHDSVTCDEFKKLADDITIADDMLMDLAQRNQWRSCPNCNIFVEKSRGCMFLKCRFYACVHVMLSVLRNFNGFSDECRGLAELVHLIDVDVKERSSWVCSESGQPNGQLLRSVQVSEGDNNSSPTSMINSNHSTESLAAQDASSAVLGSEAEYGIDKALQSGEVQFQDESQNCSRNPSNGMVLGSLEVRAAGRQYKVGSQNPGSPNLGSPKQLPVDGNMLTQSLPCVEPTYGQWNNVELSGFQRFNKDFQTLFSIPPCPLPSYEGMPSMSSGMGKERIGQYDLPGGYVDSDLFVMESNSTNLSASVISKVKQDMQNYNLPSFASGPQITLSTAGSLQSVPQTTLAGECNVSGKPRARARRGQATDPHSIAERVRREKIAERMKNLQELVPNSNKTDKASMLDEIIEYVKFLQLQVKVLSMSRLGAAGAVVPLITDGQAEGANGLSLSPSAGKVADGFPSDKISFEREVVKLMESNVTTAMQYLQSKGLCLMPIALAAAISSGRESSSSPYSDNWKRNIGFIDSPVHNENNSSLSATGIHHNKLCTESNMINKCNAAVSKPQEVHEYTYSTSDARELKPKI